MGSEGSRSRVARGAWLGLLLGLASVAGVAGIAACNLVVSTDGLAGPPLADEGGVDASADAARDAPADAADAAPRPFCEGAGPSLFCADFDRSSMPETGWTSPETKAGGELDTDDEHVSAPRGLSARVGPSISGERSARLYKELGVLPSELRVELDAKLCTVGSGIVEWIKVEFPAPSIAQPPPGYENSDVALSMNDEGESSLQLEHYRRGTSPFAMGYPVADGPPVGRWFHVRLDIGVSSRSSGYVRLYVDDRTSPAFSRDGIQTVTDGSVDTRVLVGAYTYGNDDGCTNLFDNVIVTEITK